jgi:hypothetical protein
MSHDGKIQCRVCGEMVYRDEYWMHFQSKHPNDQRKGPVFGNIEDFLSSVDEICGLQPGTFAKHCLDNPDPIEWIMETKI